MCTITNYHCKCYNLTIHMMRACANSFVSTKRLRTFALVRDMNTVTAVPCVQEHEHNKAASERGPLRQILFRKTSHGRVRLRGMRFTACFSLASWKHRSGRPSRPAGCRRRTRRRTMAYYKFYLFKLPKRTEPDVEAWMQEYMHCRPQTPNAISVLSG